jgi:hypothetical protein
MKFAKVFLIQFVMIMVIFSLISPSFSQIKQEKRIIHSGMIELVSEDFKYISINERRIPITPKTSVIDTKGNILKISELKSGLYVVVELIRKPDGSLEKRIVVKK